ncbi:MAG TPA: Scr1 family TA system antitoxin-like transcriptional regulator [Candidatus Saccharimonadales bacterium]|nr:Scr1 family TA system antitoxin-like transcriptional regulator [Candidatus Saccharimonadales bacterium]
MTRLDVAAEIETNGGWMDPTFQEYLKAEQTADRLRIVGSSLLLPGLLQTDGIAIAIDRWAGSDPDNIGAQVSLRLRRQRILDSLDGGAHFFLPEDAITNNPMSANTNVLRHQIDDLITRTYQDGVSLRILPNGMHPAPGPGVNEAAGPGGTAVYTEDPSAGRDGDRHFYRPDDAEVARYSGIIDACGEAALSEGASRGFLEQAYADLAHN